MIVVSAKQSQLCCTKPEFCPLDADDAGFHGDQQSTMARDLAGSRCALSLDGLTAWDAGRRLAIIPQFTPTRHKLRWWSWQGSILMQASQALLLDHALGRRRTPLFPVSTTAQLITTNGY